MPDRQQYAFNLAVVGAASLAGFLTVIILVLALFAGLWLDNRFASENHIYTIVLLCASVPVTLVAMLAVVQLATSYIRTPKQSAAPEEDAERG